MRASTPLKIVVLCLAFMFSLIMNACAAQSDGMKVVRVGVCLSLSGQYAMHGAIDLAGVVLRAEELNAESEKTGIRVVPVVYDAKSDPETAAGLVETLVEEEGVKVIVGPSVSALVPAMSRKAAELGAVLVSPSVTTPGIGKQGQCVFSVIYDDAFQGVMLSDFAREKVGAETAAIVYNRDNAYSRSISAVFRESFVKGGGTLVLDESYSARTDLAEEVNFIPTLEKIRAAGPEIVLLPNYHEEVVAIMNQAMDFGLKTRFCGGDAWAFEDIPLAAGYQLKGAFYIIPYDPFSREPRFRRFVELLNECNLPGAETFSVMGYDALSLAVAAMLAVEPGESVADTLYRVREFPLASGKLILDPEMGVLKSAYICEVVEVDNRFVEKVVGVFEPETPFVD